MNRFLELPLPQRLLIVGIFLAIIGGGFYYLVISEMSESIATEYRKKQSLETEYSKLKEFDKPEFREKLIVERKKAEKKKEEYQKMLPVDEEIPELIMSVKSDADVSGLTITRFEKSKEKIYEDYYAKIPVKMEVYGTFHQFLTFLKSIAAPYKRILNIKDIYIEVSPPPREVVEQYIGDIGPIRILKERERVRPLSDREKYALKVLMFEEQSKLSSLKISFTTYAFIYTGQPKLSPKPLTPQGGRP